MVKHNNVGYTKILNDNVENEAETNTGTSDAQDHQDSYSEVSSKRNRNMSYLQELEEVPQGRHLGLFSTIVLFVSRIVGSGIFATSSGIYQDVGGSPFLFFLAWTFAAILSFSGLYVYLELGSLVPRSGGTKVFLEFIYEKPYMLASVVFLIYSVMFGFNMLNSLVFGEYFLHAIGVKASEFQSRMTGLLCVYVAACIHGISYNSGVMVQNVIGGMKLVLLFVMVITGFYLVFLPSSITHIESNFNWDDFFRIKTNASAATFASAIIKATFSFYGWNSAHTVSNEIKDPTRTFKIAGPVSLGIVTIAYFFTNLAYIVVITDDELIHSGQLIGSLLFEKVFGYKVGKQFLTFSVALCAAGNIFVVLYTISRVSQEVFREGFLPYSKFMASNWPFGAPLPTLILSCTLSTLVILAPKGDLYNYFIALEGYPNQIFLGLTALGTLIIRKRYPDVRAPIRSSLTGTVFLLLITIYLIVFPFVSRTSPNPKGLENWPSYAVVAVLCLSGCVLYWVIMFSFLPWYYGYNLVPKEVELKDGLVVKEWTKNYENFSVSLDFID